MVAEDRGEAAVGFGSGGTGEEFAEFGAGVDFQEGAEIDVAEDVVFDEDPSQGDFFGKDGLGDFVRHIAEVEADDAELDDFLSAVLEEDDFAGVNRALLVGSEDANIDGGVMKRLHGDSHVVFVDQEIVIGLGSGCGGDVFGLRDQAVAGEEVEERLEIDEWVHVFYR